MNTLRNTLFFILLLPAITILSSHIPSSAIPTRYQRYEQQRKDNIQRIITLQAQQSQNSPTKKTSIISPHKKSNTSYIDKIDTSDMSDISSDDDKISITTSQNKEITKNIRKYNELQRANSKHHILKSKFHTNNFANIDPTNLTLDQLRRITYQATGLDTQNPQRVLSYSSKTSRTGGPLTEDDIKYFDEVYNRFAETMDIKAEEVIDENDLSVSNCEQISAWIKEFNQKSPTEIAYIFSPQNNNQIESFKRK